MLGWRLLISAIVVPVLCAIFYSDHRLGGRAVVLWTLCVLLSARAVWEMTHLLATRSFRILFWPTVGGALLVLSSGWGAAWSLPGQTAVPGSFEALGLCAAAYAMSILGLFLVEALRYREPGQSMETLGAEVLIVSYVGLLMAVTVQLRWVAGVQAGYLALGSLLVAAKSGDIGAYTLGRLFGRRKMIPRLSPGKTWAGAAGAVLGGAGGSYLWLRFATPLFDSNWPSPAWWAAVVYGIVLGVVGLIGDLCESLIKRDVGKKDSAPLLPGFGGLLDLLDSVLYAGPVAWVLWQTLPLATWVLN